jgi:hypothetical protein
MNKYSDVSSLAEQTVRDAQLLHSEKSLAGPTLFLAATSPGGQSALKVWRTWIDTVDFQPPILIPDGPQEKEKRTPFFPSGERSDLTWRRRTGTLVLRRHCYWTSVMWTVIKLSTFEKRYCLENSLAYLLQMSTLLIGEFKAGSTAVITWSCEHIKKCRSRIRPCR